MKKLLLNLLIVLWLASSTTLLAQPVDARPQNPLPPLPGKSQSPLDPEQASRAAEQQLIELLKAPEYTPIREFLANYINGLRENQLNMQRAINELHIETLLTRVTLENAETLAQGRKRVEKFLQLLNDYETSSQKLMVAAEVDVLKIDMPVAFKEGFVDGFKSSKQVTLRQLTEFFDVERSCGQLFLDIISFMESRQGAYRFQSDQLLFDSQANLDQYQEYLQRLDKLSQREQAIIAEMQQDSKASLKNMEDTLKSTEPKK